MISRTFPPWNLKLALTFAILSWSNTVYAQPTLPDYQRVVIDALSPADPWMKSVGDLSGDGQPDLVVAGANGPIIWYKAPNWIKGTISTGGQGDSGSEIGDIDGDGDNDVIVGRSWYENSGNGITWIPHLIDDAVNTHDISIAFVNADAKADVIMRGEDANPVTIFLQITPTSWTKFSINPGVGLNGLDVADINADGKSDVVVAGVWMENPGGSIATTPWPKHIFCTWNNYACVKVVDMDGDGRPDVVLSVSEATGKLSWFKAPVDPTTGPWTERIIATGLDKVHTFVVADLDHNGLPDVTASEYDGVGRLIAYLNQGGGTTWQANILGTDKLHNLRGADLNFDGFTDFFGVYAIGGNPVIVYLSELPLPIQLASFIAYEIPGHGVRLDWATISEVNNFGFYVQRKGNDDSTFAQLLNAFIPGHGTTNEPQYYAYLDSTAGMGTWQYRLKQVDLDGTVHYSDPIQVSILTSVSEPVLPMEFCLRQNYPNPFNPSTTIKYDLPEDSRVALTLFNVLGQEVVTLVNEDQNAGYKSIDWNAAQFASSIYFCRLQAGTFVQTRKFLLLK